MEHAEYEAAVLSGSRLMKDSDRQLLVTLRRALLNLHKTLLDGERASYERVHGRTSAGELLKITVSDPQFAWLRALSELIVRMDESLEIDALEGPEIDVDLLLSQVRTVVSPDESGTPYAQRYHTALQEHPDAVLAHSAVTTVLKTPRT
jgi:hypothetical protein